MLRSKLICISALVSVMAVGTPAFARNDTLFLSIKDVLESDMAKEKLDGSVKFRFGGSSGGSTIKANLISNRKTNAVGKSDEESCKIAMLSALISFQDTAKKLGASRVNNLTSYYDKKVYRSSTQYECHAGSMMSGVVLRGDIAR